MKFSTMSFNILYLKPDEQRINRVIKTISHYMPDTFGVQEATPFWMETLSERLGDTYSFVGEGRDGDNKGEYSPVFYKKDKFEPTESGTKWLSATPDVKKSKFESSSMPRIFSYAVLKCKDSDCEYLHINTHLEHSNHQAREEQIGVLAEFARRYKSCPTVVTGDFNSEYMHKPYEIMMSEGFADSAKEAICAENTARTFLGDILNPVSFEKVIDFCFIRGATRIPLYRVITDKIDGQYPSDHLPVYTEFEL